MPDGCDVYFRAFYALRDDRQYGDYGGAARISFIAIETWARKYELPEEHFDVFVALLHALDDEYLAWLAEQAAKKTPKETPP